MVTIEPAVWIDGECQAGERHVSARDRGLTLGDGVFETMRASRGVVFRLDRHMARLARALATLCIDAPPDLRAWVMRAVDAAGPGEASVRLTVTRGAAATGGVAPPPEARPTAIVTIAPMPAFEAAIYDRGLAARVASGRRNEHAMSAGLKTLAYTDAVLALLEARRAGADDALFLDTEGHCSEATSSNLFVWTGTTLVTPPVGCAALPGITRAAVIELAAASRIAAAERAFGLDELHAAKEAFLTSSLRGIAPLVRVGERAIGGGTPGPVTRRIAAAYADLVARECGR